MEIKQIKNFDEKLISTLFTESGDKIIKCNKEFFDNEQNILLVAFEDDNLLGYLYAHILDSLNDIKPKGFLYSIDVFPKYRKKGIATKLMNKLKSICISKNCSEIFVFTNEKNIPAMNLYTNNGGNRENDDDVMFVFDL